MQIPAISTKSIDVKPSTFGWNRVVIAIAFSRKPTKRLPVPSRSRRSINGRIGIAPRPLVRPRIGALAVSAPSDAVRPATRGYPRRRSYDRPDHRVNAPVRPWHPPCAADTIGPSEPVPAPRAPLGGPLSRPPRPPRALWADVAQLVEQLIRNQQVAGSNPAVGSILRRFVG